MVSETAFCLINHSFVGPPLSASFENLPGDPYCPGRRRRFSQYRIAFQQAIWQAITLPHRPHIQTRVCNSYIGGHFRPFEPLVINPGPIIDRVARSVPLDQSQEWHVDVHQWRTVCPAGQKLPSVPEGPHRDGHRFGAILVMALEGISGGETLVYQSPNQEDQNSQQEQPTQKIIFQSVLTPGMGLVFDDQRLMHHTTELLGGHQGGYRDIFVLDFNLWQERRYGQGFERWALSESERDVRV